MLLSEYNLCESSDAVVAFNLPALNKALWIKQVT